MRYFERPPAATLAPFVECLWTVEDLRPKSNRQTERVVPDGCPELIVHLGDTFSRHDGDRRRWNRQPTAFLAGPLTAPWLLRPGTRVRCLGVRFRPGKVRAFFDVDLLQARDREVPLVSLLGTDATNTLRTDLDAARTIDRRFALLEGRLATWRARKSIGGRIQLAAGGSTATRSPRHRLDRRARRRGRIQSSPTRTRVRARSRSLAQAVRPHHPVSGGTCATR